MHPEITPSFNFYQTRDTTKLADWLFVTVFRNGLVGGSKCLGECHPSQSALGVIIDEATIPATGANSPQIRQPLENA